MKPYSTTLWSIPKHKEDIYAPKQHTVALVIPVINEGVRIQAQLNTLKELNYQIDIIIADGGSADGSLEPKLFTETGVTACLTKQDAGKLSAQLRMAYAWCLQQGYTGIITVDGNNKDDMTAIPRFLDKLKSGYDYIQGSRYMAGGAAMNTPLERTIGNRLIHSPYLSLMSGYWYSDTTNGFRAYSANYLTDSQVAPFRDVFQTYELLFYLTVRANKLGYKTCNVPVTRSYPKNSPTPTKINGFKGKWAILEQMFLAGLGRYNPQK